MSLPVTKRKRKTRKRLSRRKRKESLEQPAEETPAKEEATDTESDMPGAEFAEDIFSGGKTRDKKTRKEKREHNLRFILEQKGRHAHRDTRRETGEAPKKGCNKLQVEEVVSGKLQGAANLGKDETRLGYQSRKCTCTA